MSAFNQTVNLVCLPLVPFCGHNHIKPFFKAENAATPKKTQDFERYGITRGAAYFAKGGNR